MDILYHSIYLFNLCSIFLSKMIPISTHFNRRTFNFDKRWNKKKLIGLIGIERMWGKLQAHFRLNCYHIVEPARFEMASRNISTRRNDPISLSCLAKGDDHINIIWLHNNNRIDLNNYR